MPRPLRSQFDGQASFSGLDVLSPLKGDHTAPLLAHLLLNGYARQCVQRMAVVLDLPDPWEGQLASEWRLEVRALCLRGRTGPGCVRALLRWRSRALWAGSPGGTSTPLTSAASLTSTAGRHADERSDH